MRLSLAAGDDIRLGFFLNPGGIIIKANFLKFTCLGTNEEKFGEKQNVSRKINKRGLAAGSESDEECEREVERGS